jgi:hypothetical protein
MEATRLAEELVFARCAHIPASLAMLLRQRAGRQMANVKHLTCTLLHLR